MAYLFKQKINLADLVSSDILPKRILIYEPETYLAALYSHYLRLHNFDIKHCPDLRKVSEIIKSFQPHLLIFRADGPNPAFKIPGLISVLSRRFPDLRLITIARDLSHQGIKDLMDAGVVSHLNRSLSRPQDIAVLVKAILQ